MNRNYTHFSKLKLFLPWLISISTLLILFYFVDLNMAIVILKKMSLENLILGSLFYLGTYFWRTLRYSVLLDEYDFKYADLFLISIIHGFYNKILPARTGEVAYVFIVKDFYKTPVSKSVSSLLIYRIYDLITSLLLAVIAALLMISSFSIYNLSLMIIIIILLLLFLFLLPHFLLFFQKIIKTSFCSRLLSPFILPEKVYEQVDVFTQAIIAANSKRKVFFLAIYSLTTWLSLFAAFYVLLTGFNINLKFTQVIVGSIFATMTNILPISGVGGFGTMESGWTLGFMLIGLDKTTAISTGFAINTIVFVITVLFGGLGLTFYRKRKRSINFIGGDKINENNRPNSMS